jgi:hypothetical protein
VIWKIKRDQKYFSVSNAKIFLLMSNYDCKKFIPSDEAKTEIVRIFVGKLNNEQVGEDNIEIPLPKLEQLD